jgi:hypothetical protein
MVEISITHVRHLDSFDGLVKYAKTFSMLRSIIGVRSAKGITLLPPPYAAIGP